MEKLFKRSMTLLICTFVVCLCAKAGNDKVISDSKEKFYRQDSRFGEDGE